MTASGDCFVRLDTMRGADNGSGGLASQSTPAENPAFVRMFHQVESPNFESTNWPDIGIEIIDETVDSFAKDRCNLLVIWHLKTEWEPGSAKQQAVEDRIRSVYHRQAIGSSSTWDFSTASMTSFASVARGPDQKLHRRATSIIRGRKI